MGGFAICWATPPAKGKPGTKASGSALPGPLESVGVGSKGPAPLPPGCRRLPGGGARAAEEEPSQPQEQGHNPLG